MKNFIIQIIFVIIISMLIFGLGFGVGIHFGKGKIKVEIKEVKVVETKFIKVPQNNDEAMKCAMSPIHINAKVDDNKIIVKAFDDCKETTSEIKIDTKVDIVEIGKVGVVGFLSGFLFLSLVILII